MMNNNTFLAFGLCRSTNTFAVLKGNVTNILLDGRTSLLTACAVLVHSYTAHEAVESLWHQMYQIFAVCGSLNIVAKCHQHSISKSEALKSHLEILKFYSRQYCSDGYLSQSFAHFHS